MSDVLKMRKRGSLRMEAVPRSGIRHILDLASDNSINLAAGDPGFDTPRHIVDACNRALADGATHYTNGRGLGELREAWAEKLLRENRLDGIDPYSEIVVTAGALNALSASLLALVDAGDRVLVPNPGFANYEAQIRMAGGSPIPIRCPYSDRFRPDISQLEKEADSASVMIINSPSNPTGAVLSRATLLAISEIAIRNDLLVIADEAYEHLVFGDAEHISIASLPGMAERTLSIHSMSKSWAMTGWRVGFVTGPADLVDIIAKAQEHVIGCPPAMTQWAALAALKGSTESRQWMVGQYLIRRNRVIDVLSSLPSVDFIEPQGSFYAFPRFGVGLDSVTLARRLAAETGVLTVPGAAFGSEGASSLRISFSGDESALEDGLARLSGWYCGQFDIRR